MLIDSHAHLDFEVISKNIKQIVDNALDCKISSILSINTRINNFNNLLKKAVSLIRELLRFILLKS